MPKVLITGGNAGLGLEIAKLLLAKNYEVIILGRNAAKLARVKADLNSSNLSTIQCDLQNYEEIKAALISIENLDVLINNAGIINYISLEKQDPQNIQDIVQTNLLGTIFVTRELLGKFKAQNSGIILNIASTAGLPTGGGAGGSVYMASKYGLSGFTEGLKKELLEEKKNVRVLELFPGGMQTELFAKAGVDKNTSKYMNPKDVAKVVVFMLQQPNSINIDQIVLTPNKMI